MIKNSKQEYNTQKNIKQENNTLKIVSGLGSIDDYVQLVKAGADEFFSGFVPYEWAQKYGVISPLNRREVMFYNVQLGSFSELKILKAMVDTYHVPVKITLNSLFYTVDMYPIIEELILRCMDIGFDTFIIADPALILHLRNKKIACKIHLSGETAEVNHLMMDAFNAFHIKRYIFHRKNTIADMRSCIQHQQNSCMEYEAFILNERCHYTGAFCNSLHCDELNHLCKVPYQLSLVSGKQMEIKEQEIWHGRQDSMDTGNSDFISNYKSKSDCSTDQEQDFNCEDEIDCNTQDEPEGYHTGDTGCGLCAIKQLKAAGVTHLKLVGRGNYVDYMEQDIRQLRRAIEYADRIEDEQEFVQTIKQTIQNGYCSGECYYR